MDRELDGMYFRVQRNGKWEAVCLSDMDEAEIHNVLSTKDMTFVMSVVVHLAQTLKKIGDQLDIQVERKGGE